MKRLLMVLALLAALGGTALVRAQDGDAQTPDAICDANTPAPEPATRSYTQADDVLQPGVDYRAVFCTGAGAVYVDLLEDYAPITVNNFVFLAQQGYYNNTTFHRVIPDFMAQGGDPTATGSGGPGYQFQDEFVGFLHFDTPGWLAMANANNPQAGVFGTNGSQFFITTVATDWLDYNHTIFGEVLEGQDVVDTIQVRDPAVDTAPGTALDTVVILDDPALVLSDYTTPDPATADDVLNGMDTVDNDIPADLGLTFSRSDPLDADTAAAALNLDAGTLGDFNFDYAVTSTLENVTCNLDAVPFMSIGYMLLHFATRDDARAAFDDGFLQDAMTNNGFVQNDDPTALTAPFYVTTLPDVCNQDAELAVVYLLRGSFIARAEVIVPPGAPVAPAQVWLSQFVLLRYERAVSDVLRRELR